MNITVCGNSIDISAECYVYVLTAIDNGVFYVGSSKKPIRRIQEHKFKGVNIDNIDLIPVNSSERFNIEAALIVKYNPKLNGHLPKNDSFITKNKMSSLYGLGFGELMGLNLECVYKRSFFKGFGGSRRLVDYCYYRVSEVDELSKAIQEYADTHTDGNFSMAARQLIKKGLLNE